MANGDPSEVDPRDPLLASLDLADGRLRLSSAAEARIAEAGLKALLRARADALAGVLVAGR